jgi:hypothetical protein
MRWAFVEFTHYTGDDALENFSAADYTRITADSLADAVKQIATIQGQPLARIDDGDSPYGGVYTNARLARRYWILNDHVRSNTTCYGIFAESVLNLPFTAMRNGDSLFPTATPS